VASGTSEAELMAAAAAQGARLGQTFAAMRDGAALPAHGAESVCQWCEMAGLCRKEFFV
jgi:ATP-dependent helicase/nuclease subunit B